MVSSEVHHILTYPKQHEHLNKRSELFCKCRHENNYPLKNFRVNDKGKLNILTEGKSFNESLDKKNIRKTDDCVSMKL